MAHVKITPPTFVLADTKLAYVLAIQTGGGAWPGLDASVCQKCFQTENMSFQKVFK